MTQPEFNALPGLLSRKLFLQLTGLTWRDLDGPEGLRATGKVRVYIKRNGTCRYYKADAAPYLGFNNGNGQHP